MEKSPISPEANKNANKPVESDSEKIVRRHMENKDDEITDEDIRNVRITGDEEEPVTTGAEAKAKFLKGDPEEKEEIDKRNEPGTPWDVLSE